MSGEKNAASETVGKLITLLGLGTVFALIWDPGRVIVFVYKAWSEWRREIILGLFVCVFILLQFAPDWIVELSKTVFADYFIAGVKSVPSQVLDGIVLYAVTFFFNWCNAELKKDDPVTQLFAGRLNTSLNLIMDGGDLGLRTLSEDCIGDYFPSEEAQQSMFEQV